MTPSTRTGVAFVITCITYIVAGLVALFAPDTVLTDNGLLRVYADAVTNIVDVRGNNYGRSSFPEVSKLYHSIAMLSVPFWICIWLGWMRRSVGRNSRGLLFRKKLTLFHRIVLLAMVPIFMLLAYAFLLNHGGDTRLVSFGTSRIQLATFGMMFEMGMTGTFCMSLFGLWRAVTPSKNYQEE